MNYRHAYHAGNFADVVKHLALTAILLHLRKKEAPFAVIDTHAGRGIYDLADERAARTGEAANGIGKLGGVRADGALGEYLRIAGRDARYSGSPLIAAALLRPQDRLVAIEKHPEEFAALKTNLAGARNARAEGGDGYTRLPALLPPPERRGVVLIDPPFESDDEFAAEADALRVGLRRWTTGIFLLWFPIKSAAEANAFAGEILNAGAKKAVRIDLDIGSQAQAIGTKTRLTATGLIAVNAPYGFAEELRTALVHIAPLLSPQAKSSVRVLIDELS